jgi:hypothetical protein
VLTAFHHRVVTPSCDSCPRLAPPLPCAECRSVSILCIRPHEIDWLAVQLNRIYVLDLRGRRIGDDGGALLARALERNTSLTSLSLQVLP